MQQPLLSIIIVIYNVEKYIEECLNSILKQDFHDMEILCINDGSTDNSLVLLKQLQQQDSRIKIITQENQGPARVRNKGMELSRGQYLWFIDGDDFIAENCVPLLAKEIKSHQKSLDMLYINVMNYYEKTGSTQALYQFDQSYENRCITGLELLKNSSDIHMGMWSKIIRRDFCLQYGKNPDDIYYEDLIPGLTLLENAQNLVYLPLDSYYYRQTTDSITHRKYSQLHIESALFNAEQLMLAYNDKARFRSIVLENALLYMCYIAFAFGSPFKILKPRRKQLQKQLRTIFKSLSPEARTEHNSIDNLFYCYYPVFLVNNSTQKMIQFIKKLEYFFKKLQRKT